MNSDYIQDEINDNDMTNNKSGDKNFISYLSDIFLGKNNVNDDNNVNDENDDDKIYDDYQEDFEESYKNLINLSKMNMDKIYNHFKISGNIDEQKVNSYNNKYSNILVNTNNYETDYELKINDNESIEFLKSKK